MKYVISLILLFTGPMAFGSNDDLKEIYELVKTERYAEAFEELSSHKSLMLGKIEFEYEDEFGDSVEVSGQQVDADIKTLQGFKRRCDGYLVDPHSDPVDTLRHVKSDCGPHGMLGKLVKRIKLMSGVDLTDIPKSYLAQAEGLVEQEKQKKEMIASREAKAEEAKAEYEKTPEYVAEVLCRAAFNLEAMETAKNREVAASKHSGYVDKHRMHRLGRLIEARIRQIRDDKAKYQRMTGKAWDQSECPS